MEEQDNVRNRLGTSVSHSRSDIFCSIPIRWSAVLELPARLINDKFGSNPLTTMYCFTNGQTKMSCFMFACGESNSGEPLQGDELANENKTSTSTIISSPGWSYFYLSLFPLDSCIFPYPLLGIWTRQLVILYVTVLFSLRQREFTRNFTQPNMLGFQW